ncbi:MAG: hypothetical protein M5Z89_16235 [Olivibacter sp.]|nr:hypothetical protein [Olivibacter sp. UJ_SKK_5.1]
MKIKRNTVVSLRYRMSNSKGEILEDLMNGPAIEYLYGDGKIDPQLEQELAGLQKGDQKKITLEKNVGKGLDDSFELEVIIDTVRLANKAEIGKGLKRVTVAFCDEQCNCYR